MKPCTINDHLHRILGKIDIISPSINLNVVAEFYYLIGFCQIQQGAQFEYVL